MTLERRFAVEGAERRLASPTPTTARAMTGIISGEEAAPPKRSVQLVLFSVMFALISEFSDG